MKFNEMMTVEELLNLLPSRDEEKFKRNNSINNILREYLKTVTNKKNPIVYGRVITKNKRTDSKYLYVIEILYLATSNDTLSPWEGEYFYHNSVLYQVSNITSSESIIQSIDKGDYVKFHLIPCVSEIEVYIKNNFYTFNFNELKKIPSISKAEEKQILYIAHICDLKCKNGTKVVFPISDEIESALSSKVKSILDEKSKAEYELEEAMQNLDKIQKKSAAEKEYAEKNRDIIQKEVDKLNNDKQRLLDEKENVTREISDYEKDLNLKKKSCSKLNQELAAEENKLQKKREELISCEKSCRDLQPVIEAARRYKYLSEENEVSSVQDTSTVNLSNNLNDDIANIINALNEQTGWDYPDYIVRSMLLGVRSKQLIILCGEPGSGKTSFAKAFSKVVGYKEAAIIPVQSNWMDSSDLLGYYNPQSEKYVPTQFLEELVECNKLAMMNKDKLFFICLDEMNLSHIEYYFADFLSALQNDRKIRLYDKNSMTLEYFPAILELAENIHFIGTINIDDTTKNLSPKVVDRSFFIRIENDDRINERMTDSLREVTYNVLKDRLNAHLKSKLSYRFDHALNNIKIDKDDEKSKAAIVNALVLPKFNDEYEPEDVEEFKSLLGEAVVNELNQGDKWYSYWRR